MVTIKSFALVAVLPATVTVIFPEVAPAGTVTVILVAVLAVTVAVVPLNCTVLFEGVVLKFAPVIVTEIPTEPEVGVNEVIVGTDTKLQTEADGVSPVIVHNLVLIKLVLADTALVPYCLPVAPSVLPLGVEGLVLHPITVA